MQCHRLKSVTSIKSLFSNICDSICTVCWLQWMHLHKEQSSRMSTNFAGAWIVTVPLFCRWESIAILCLLLEEVILRPQGNISNECMKRWRTNRNQSMHHYWYYTYEYYLLFEFLVWLFLSFCWRTWLHKFSYNSVDLVSTLVTRWTYSILLQLVKWHPLTCLRKSILTLDRHADDQEGLWSIGEAAQYTHEILQSVRDPSLLIPQGVSLSIIFDLVW